MVYLAFAILLHLNLEPYIVNGLKQPKALDPALAEDLMMAKSNNYRASSEEDDDDDTMLCKRVVTKDRRYITQITCFEKGTVGNQEKKDSFTSNRNAMRLPVFGKQNGGALASLFSFPKRQLFGGTSNVKIKTKSSCILLRKFLRFCYIHSFGIKKIICIVAFAREI